MNRYTCNFRGQCEADIIGEEELVTCEANYTPATNPDLFPIVLAYDLETLTSTKPPTLIVYASYGN